MSIGDTIMYTLVGIAMIISVAYICWGCCYSSRLDLPKKTEWDTVQPLNYSEAHRRAVEAAYDRDIDDDEYRCIVERSHRIFCREHLQRRRLRRRRDTVECDMSACDNPESGPSGSNDPEPGPSGIDKPERNMDVTEGRDNVALNMEACDECDNRGCNEDGGGTRRQNNEVNNSKDGIDTIKRDEGDNIDDSDVIIRDHRGRGSGRVVITL